MRSPEEILNDMEFEHCVSGCKDADGCTDWKDVADLRKQVTQAMHTYAQQQAVGFVEWREKHCKSYSWLNYIQLYQLFLIQQNQK